MPPVLGPWSLSKTRLWSCDATSGTTRAPSLITRNDSSSPLRHSSSTTRDPASPSILPLNISSAVRCASRFVDFFLFGADGILRSRDAVPLHELLGEALARFQLRGSARGSENRPATPLKFIHHTKRQRQFRTYKVTSGASLLASCTSESRLLRSAATHSASAAIPPLPG